MFSAESAVFNLETYCGVVVVELVFNH